MSEWLMFRHDSSHKGTSPSQSPKSEHLKWSFSTNASVCSSPAVANGKVFILSYDGNLYCIDSITGIQDWSQQLKSPGSWYAGGASSPAVYKNRVYVGARDMNVYCLVATTGDPSWKYTMGAQVGPSIPGVGVSIDCTDSSPAIAYDRVYIGSGDHNVYCLIAESGKLKWKYLTGGGINSSPSVANGKVYIGSYDRMLYCIDADSGKLIWRFPTDAGLGIYPGGIYSSPSVTGDRVFVGANDGYVYCLNAQSGHLASDRPKTVGKI